MYEFGFAVVPTLPSAQVGREATPFATKLAIERAGTTPPCQSVVRGCRQRLEV